MSKLIEIIRFQQNRRNQYDVTNRVRIDSAEATCRAVCRIFKSTYQTEAPELIHTLFEDFSDLYEGKYAGYHACDTLYHDLQHSLDATLALSRLISGYEQQTPTQPLGETRFILGVITALFHDAGYIRRHEQDTAVNGAIYTYEHVERSAMFLNDYLKKLSLDELIELSSKLVHFTGYEKPLDDLVFNDPLDHRLGQLLGTADLIAQLSDRCYLEKCRDRLFPEFILANLTPNQSAPDRYQPGSPVELLQQTLDFYRNVVLKRLEFDFDGSHRFANAYFKGRNYYMESIDNNLLYLEAILQKNDFSQLNRRPPATSGSKYFPYHLIEFRKHSHHLLWAKNNSAK